MGRRIWEKSKSRSTSFLLAFALAVAAAFAGAALAASGGGAAPLAHRADGEHCPDGLVYLSDRAVTGTKMLGFCLSTADEPTAGSRVVPLYGRAARTLIGVHESQTGKAATRDALVVCWNEPDWSALDEAFRAGGTAGIESTFGWVQIPRIGSETAPQPVVNLSPAMCELLDAMAYGADHAVDEARARALSTLAHEAMHVAGIRPEAIAECYAMQLAVTTSVALGLGEDYGRALGKLRYETYRERSRGTVYESSACEEKLKYDLGLDGFLWS